MNNQILIFGNGRGKTHLASLLAADYKAKGTPHTVVHVGSQREAQKLTPPLPNAGLIVVSNMPVELTGSYQTITVTSEEP